MNLKSICVVKLVLFLNIYPDSTSTADLPCAARHIANQSVVCVCNATYCDSITREAPAPGHYVAYTSSQAGSRFRKQYGTFEKSDPACPLTFILEPEIKYQTIEGFGAAITDSAALNWVSLPSAKLRQHLIDSYFSDRGIQYSVLRVPIGGTDFSTHRYSYNELPVNDLQLRNFSLSYEDFHYKIPMIKSAIEASCADIHILSTTWSPPEWMKRQSNYTDCGMLKTEFYQTYADYHYKFIEQYTAQNIPIWGITTTNEPANGFLPMKKFNCLGWTSYHMGLWISNFLGPTLRSSRFKKTKILAIDDQRYTIPLWFNEMLEAYPSVLHYIDGVAIHWYSNILSPPEQLTLVTSINPKLFVMATEACEGVLPWETPKVSIGSWERAKNYALDIMTNLNFDVVGWLDWNICLNEEGGPVWNDNNVDSPVLVSIERGEFIKQPMFYAMGHFSKFIPRGSRRIHIKDFKCLNAPTPRPTFTISQVKDEIVEHVAFQTQKNTIVVVFYNRGPDIIVSIQLRDHRAPVHLEASSIVTVELCSG